MGVEEYDNGSTDEGIALIFNGSSSGIIASGTPANANVFIESNQSDGDLGAKVSTIGDINGDGFGDIMVGAYGYDNGQTEEGHAFIYYGNSSTGKKYLTRQLRADLSTPLQANGHGNNPSQFGISQYVWSGYGRVSAKLSWEIKGNGVAFSGNPITSGQGSSGLSSSWTDIGTAGTTITQVVTKAPSKRTLWRVRIKYHTAKMPFGQPYSRWFYGTLVGSKDIGVLPVELLSFDARCMNESMKISWTTASETNNNYFILERSSDTVSWAQVDMINGAGNSNAILHYNLNDQKAGSSAIYYRLKQVDHNGAVNYLPVITAACDEKEKLSLELFPNPAGYNTPSWLIITTTLKEQITLSLYSYSGEEVVFKKIIPSAAETRIPLEIMESQMAAGTYSIKATTQSGKIKVIKMIVVK